MYIIVWLLFWPIILFAQLQIEIVPASLEDMDFVFYNKEDQFNEKLPGWNRAWSQFRSALIDQQGTLALTDFSDVPKKRHHLIRFLPWMQLKKQTDLIIAWGMPHYLHADQFANIPRHKQILILIEPPTIIPSQYEDKAKKIFRKIYTWKDDLVDNRVYFKYHYPVLHPPIEKEVAFKDKKLLCMIVANKFSEHPDELYSKRRRLIQFFDSYPGFDLFGHGWKDEAICSYRGSVDDKIDTASRYRFSLCLENMGNIQGYITEKIFDAFAALSVPIYEGASNITDYIPQECFIDLRQFNSFEALAEYILTMPEDRYQEYIDHIRTFLKSDQAKVFHPNTFAQLMKNELKAIE